MEQKKESEPKNKQKKCSKTVDVAGCGGNRQRLRPKPTKDRMPALRPDDPDRQTVRDWCVQVVFRGMDNFIVKNVTKEEAVRIAEERFNNGEQTDHCGNEWQRLERTGEIEAI